MGEQQRALEMECASPSSSPETVARVPSSQLHLGQLPLEDLFFTTRFPSMWNWTWGNYVYILTFPLWVVVGALRFCTLVGIAYVLYFTFLMSRAWRDWIVTMVYRYAIYPILGVRMHVTGLHDLGERPGLVVANHISNFDGWIFRGIFPLYALVNVKYDSAYFVRTIFHNMCTPIYVSRDNHPEVREMIVTALEKENKPLVMFPEGGITTGLTGTLMYHKFVFSLGVPVFPCAVSCTTPFPFRIDTLLAGLLGNTFWLLVMPWSHCYFHFMPPMRANPGETSAQFATRVQQATSDFLGIKATNYMYREKVALVQRIEKAWRPKWKRILPFPASLVKKEQAKELAKALEKLDDGEEQEMREAPLKPKSIARTSSSARSRTTTTTSARTRQAV